MQSRLLHQVESQRTFVVVLETGEEVIACLQDFVDAEQVSSAQFSGIGAFSDVVLSYFDWETKEYLKNPVSEQVEVASLIGDVATSPDGRHALACPSGRRAPRTAAPWQGHLAEAHVRPTLELVVTESPAHLKKQKDPESGLALIRPYADT